MVGRQAVLSLFGLGLKTDLLFGLGLKPDAGGMDEDGNKDMTWRVTSSSYNVFPHRNVLDGHATQTVR